MYESCVKLSYLVEKQVQGTIAHELCDDAEKLRLAAHTKNLYNVVKPGLVEHLGFFQQTAPLSETYLFRC